MSRIVNSCWVVIFGTLMFTTWVSAQSAPESPNEVTQLNPGAVDSTDQEQFDPNRIQFDEIQSAEEGTFQGKPIPKNLVVNPEQPIIVTQPRTGSIQKRQLLQESARNQSSKSIGKSHPMLKPSYRKAPAEMTRAKNIGWSTRPIPAEVSEGLIDPNTVAVAAPTIQTRVITPSFVNLQQTTPIKIQIQNTGQVVARQIRLTVDLPKHTKFSAARPQPVKMDGHRYEFVIDQLNRSQAEVIQLDVIPIEKQPLDVKTQVSLTSNQQIEIAVREPKLTMAVVGEKVSHTGKPVTHTIMIENIGDGTAENIQVNCDLPEGVELTGGNGTRYLSKLKPGATAKLTLQSVAYVPGDLKMAFRLASSRTKPLTKTQGLLVHQPQITVSASGPKMNFVNRDGIYTIQVNNVGKVDVNQVELAVAIPKGLSVNTVSRQAKVDREAGILIWKFDRIIAGSQEVIRMKATCKSAGVQICKIGASSKETRAETFDLITDVKARSDVQISVASQDGPIEIGGQSTFKVIVGNKGSQTAEGMSVHVELPPSLKPVAQSDCTINETGQMASFKSVDLAPGKTHEFTLTVVGLSEGEHVVRGVVSLSDVRRRLVAEGSVFVFEVNQSKISESLKPEFRR